MEDNVIKVSVRPNKQNSVKVSSNVVSTPITANSDTSQLWSQVSKNWAISENIVDNTDYSSKYYANKAKESASNAQGYESAIRDVYNGFLGETTEAIENVQGARDEAIANIETSRVEAVETINNTVNSAVENIGIEANKQIDNIERTGFYMRDDKLYFINSVGEEEEFKTNDNELNNPFSLLDYKFSEYALNNLSWLRSEGQYNSKAVYPAVYDLLLKIYNGTETKAGVSVKLSTEAFTDTDFVLNTAEETFRLPIKVKQKFYEDVAGIYGDNNPVQFKIEGNVRTLKNSNMYSSNWGLGLDNYGKIVNEIFYPEEGEGSTGLIAHLEENKNINLYFYVGETVQNANLINAGRIEEVVSQIKTDKLDKSAVKAYIVESYVNGASGYRTWSDKYHEEWGAITQNSGFTHTVTFLKRFKDTKYQVYVCTNYNSKGSSGTDYFYNKTVSGCGFITQNVTGTANWRASGYIA